MSSLKYCYQEKQILKACAELECRASSSSNQLEGMCRVLSKQMD